MRKKNFQIKPLVIVLLAIFCSPLVYGQELVFNKDYWEVTGRGEIEWTADVVSMKDCFISLKEQQSKAYVITFKARTPESAEQVQIWSGFGFSDRENRYALGLRGGNNNDLYLCRYQSQAKNKMLALESLDFNPQPGQWYTFKIVYWEGNIRVYVNDEETPRIVVKDEAPLSHGTAILGGGWIKTEYADLQIEDLNGKETFYAQDDQKYVVQLSGGEKETLRQQQRKKYSPLKIKRLKVGRNEFSLDGNWLFMPEYSIESISPFAEDLDDQSWHVMHVPDFWNPAGNWLHLQDSGLPHRGSGISDNYREKEYARCEGYTFDFRKTTGAWYRHHVELPNQLEGRKINLHFDAVSKVADVYVNGNHVGGHIGMFGDFNFDITNHVKPGENSIAVHVKVRQFQKAADADEHVTRAVSVDINNDMLNSLPHGMFTNTEGGIWQPVKLEITEKVHITDIYAGVRSNGGDFDITLQNDADLSEKTQVGIVIRDKQNGKTLFKSTNTEAIVPAGASKQLTIKTGNISPQVWSPHAPKMYTLTTTVYQSGKIIDKKTMDIGFRSFEVKEGQFYLNGNPYWLGGANHPPIGIAPNDGALANKFYGFMHENNQLVTRSHGSPFTSVWMQASDEQGVGVSYEGPFPWFMIGEMPSDELINIWREETLSLVKKYRNHPSLLIWTINNEMYFTMFYHNDPPEVRLKKWKIVSDVIKEIRKLSPNTVISADSGYGRVQEDYDKNLKPHDIDDGDIDDRHFYPNWYNRDFFQVYNGEWGKRIYWSPGANPDRAFFSQETSTGYTNNDDGHFNRKYLFNNYVPQSWVGDWAYEDHDPTYTAKRHAFMTKELIETIRRTSPETAGLQLFANVTWFRNVYDAERIEPYLINYQVKKAYAPVLISAELFGRSFYAGETFSPRVFIINNDRNSNDIPSGQLEWEILHNGEVLHSGKQAAPVTPFYDRALLDVSITLPVKVPVDKANCKLVLRLVSNGKTISQNDYDILVSNKHWLHSERIQQKTIGVFDLSGETAKVLDFIGIDYHKMKDLTEIRVKDFDLLIVANLDQDEEVPYNWEDVRRVMGNGTNVLLIHPGKHMQWLMYDKIQSTYERKGRVVNMHIAEHTAFDDIDPMELSWWQQNEKERPRACRRSYRLKDKPGMTSLCTYLRPHTGLSGVREETYYEMRGTPLLQVKENQGTLIASEMEVNMGDKDPVAARLLVNLIYSLIEE
ncbi:sugar-binding domain-containing protein [Tamlana sp. 2201CG12-4]|uniref:glycoside hydrolase family 2 protein n=1 Tax=Tamlana sp. 2201CG12-4 TaxID=3112582 RepID=UPI002DBBCAA3|nr:sugar-binding domain-containing protein [Tamlana sp. 2201CG12-4]MEC3908239.1 sugar-binding domain-containing protein [Tamlana sp. 2201CG12-4]